MDDDPSSQHCQNLVSLIDQYCPYFKPAIYHSKFCPLVNISDLFSSAIDKQQLQNLLSEIFNDSTIEDDFKVIYSTEVDFENRIVRVTHINRATDFDCNLANCFKIIEMMVNATELEMIPVIFRFSELNKLEGLTQFQVKQIFYQVYHSAYALHILIRNMSGWKTFLIDDIALPIPIEEINSKKTQNFFKGMTNSSEKDTVKQNTTSTIHVPSITNNDDHESSSEEDNNNAASQSNLNLKKKKRKRGKR